MKARFLGLCLITVSAAPVWAGGDHAHNHGMHSHQNGHTSLHDGGGHTSVVGRPVQSGDETRTVQVDLLDSMKFDFKESLMLKQGDVVRFVVTNRGNLRHEFSIGDAEEQKAHAEMMRRMPDMVHSDGNTVTLEAGETKELIWQFEGDGVVVFACNIPGHFQAGMFAIEQIAQ